MKVIPLNREQKLIEAAKKNDRLSQQKIYDLHAPKMLALCRQYIKDVQQAEEVMVSGFLKCFLSINSFSGAGSFEGWLRKTMVRSCLDFIKVKKNHFNHDHIENHHITDTDDVFNLLAEQDLQFIQHCIEQLPTACKLVFNLYVIEEYKHKEIS